MSITTNRPKTSDFRNRRDAIYAKVIGEMNERSSKEVLATLVKAGIYTKNGRLTKHYRPA